SASMAYRIACGSRSAARTQTASSPRRSRILSHSRAQRVPDGLGAPLAEPLFQRLELIGMGLIGSSLARVTRRKGLAREIVAVDSSADVCTRVAELALADKVTDNAVTSVEKADLVMLCAPVGAMGSIARKIAPSLEPGVIISDAGSVKTAIIKAVAPHLPPTVHFVPAHPVAGTEQSGPDAGFATLFLNRWSILTPLEGTNPKAVARLASFWTGAGANVEIMQPAHHDLVLAITS